MQCSATVFDPKIKSWLFLWVSLRKRQRKSFVRIEEICEEEREKSVHQKRERGNVEETRGWEKFKILVKRKKEKKKERDNDVKL